MDVRARLEDLKQVAAKLSIRIETGDLFYEDISIRSGHCKIEGKDFILLDRKLPPREQVETLLRILENFDLETIYVASWIRERLQPETGANHKP
ncbi:MAG: hypothetical protein ACE5E9_06450 [Nitrospinaceae bacterium]